VDTADKTKRQADGLAGWVLGIDIKQAFTGEVHSAVGVILGLQASIRCRVCLFVFSVRRPTLAKL
jgi:hypothetical protein